MKFAHKPLIIATLLASLGSAACAQQTPPAPGNAATAAAREAHGRFDPAKMQERRAKRAEALKQKLQLSGAQEAAWASYMAAHQPVRMQRPDGATLAKLSTPERVDRMRALRAARMAEMDKRGDARKAFYAALSEQQKKVFDEETARRGHRGKGGPQNKAV